MIYEAMYSIRDGETEYGDKFFVVAKSNDMSFYYAYKYLADTFWEHAHPSILQLREGIELPDDYRIITLISVVPYYYAMAVTGERIRLEVVKD